MMQRGLIALLGLGILLAGTIALELTSRVGDDGGMIASTQGLLPALPNRSAVPLAPGKDRRALGDGILARPLFAANRRPVAAPAGPVAAPTNLPRLAGILVNGRSRMVIFATGGGGRPVVVQEGAQVSGYTVQSIEPGQVTLAGPGGTQVLRPAFDARPQSATAAPATIGPAARGPAPFAAATDVMQSLRGLPGFSGAAR